MDGNEFYFDLTLTLETEVASNINRLKKEKRGETQWQMRS